MAEKPSIPKGTRDFGPVQMAKRTYIFDTIRKVFRKYGFQPLETPTMENLSVLTGKYGEEGDQLLFKILNSGDFLKDTQVADYQNGAKSFAFKVAEKGLRYDLTVPFARYVVMNRGELVFPFKRYQMQPVWRADRPQKGRYREFYQCDADVVGTESLLCEAEIVAMITEVFAGLRIEDFTIKINNRKILAGIAESIGLLGKEADLCVAIDKLDKIGIEAVNKELSEKEFSDEAIQKLQPIIKLSGDNSSKINQLKDFLQTSSQGKKGIEELEEVFGLMQNFGISSEHVEFDVVLARGLSYYTGAIFEVKANAVKIGSVSGGGRYDNLTGVFGLPNVSGVGISFGVDRLYDVLEELNLYPADNESITKVLFVNFDKESRNYAMPFVQQMRNLGISTELYPDSSKMKKQLDYANAKKIPFVILAGSNEIAEGKFTLKDMEKGSQYLLSKEEILQKIQ